MTRTTPKNPAPRRRPRLLVAGLLVALVAAGAAGFALLRPAADPAPAAAAPTSDPEPGTYGTSVLEPGAVGSPTQVPETVLADAPGLPEALSPVALDQPVDYEDGVSARLVDILAITAEGHGVGEMSGPALVVILELTNTTGAPVSLDTVAVNMYLGADGVPARHLSGDSGQPFSGSLAAGESAQAVYAFTVPTDQRDVVTVTVGHTPESGTAVFSGSVA